MKIGLFYYSYSGHTALVGDKLAGSLEEAGHQVHNFRLETAEPLQLSAINADLSEMPSVENYDVLIVGTPVHGGRMSAPVRTFLEGIPTLAGKKVAFLLTHFFPPKLGAVQTVSALEEICSGKGAILLGSEDVTWLSLLRKQQIRNVVAALSDIS